jgi:hypothetical protein
MGQYFKLVNLDKKEFVSPYDIGGVAKLWEWMANENECGVITLLLSGRWAGDRVVLVGDYDKSNLYEIAEKKYKNISSYAKKLYEIYKPNGKKIYAINKTTNEYISGSFKQVSICLVMLLRKSSESGGGDIEKIYDTAGLWAKNKIVVQEKEPPKEYENINSRVYRDAFDFYGE